MPEQPVEFQIRAQHVIARVRAGVGLNPADAVFLLAILEGIRASALQVRAYAEEKRNKITPGYNIENGDLIIELARTLGLFVSDVIDVLDFLDKSHVDKHSAPDA